MHGSVQCTFSIGMAVFIHTVSWDDEYLACSITNQIIPLFLMFHNGSQLEIFPGKQNRYIRVDNIVKVVERASNRGAY